jgi:hypothetical protein
MPIRADEDAIRQCQLEVAGTADRAELAGGVPAVDNLDCTAPPSLFVAQLAGELAPARIADGLREPAVSHHASHVEILDNQPVVGLNQRVGYLMQEMTADVGDTAMMLAQAGRSAATIK